jgi:hypothetical protein
MLHDLLWAVSISAPPSIVALLLPHDFAKKSFSKSGNQSIIKFNSFHISIFHSTIFLQFIKWIHFQKVWYSVLQHFTFLYHFSRFLSTLSRLFHSKTLHCQYFKSYLKNENKIHFYQLFPKLETLEAEFPTPTTAKNSLHIALKIWYLCWYSNKKQPRLFWISSVVDYLTAIQTGVTVKHFLWDWITCEWQNGFRKSQTNNMFLTMNTKLNQNA